LTKGPAAAYDHYMPDKFVGIGKGVQVFFLSDGSPAWKGAPRDHTIELATTRLEGSSGDEREFLERWLQTVEAQVDADHFEEQVERAAEPRLNSRDAKKIPSFARPIVEEAIREQERQRLKLQQKKGGG
jgi:hypothetical protein